MRFGTCLAEPRNVTRHPGKPRPAPFLKFGKGPRRCGCHGVTRPSEMTSEQEKVLQGPESTLDGSMRTLKCLRRTQWSLQPAAAAMASTPPRGGEAFSKAFPPGEARHRLGRSMVPIRPVKGPGRNRRRQDAGRDRLACPTRDEAPSLPSSRLSPRETKLP